jgi:hypothetical protein
LEHLKGAPSALDAHLQSFKQPAGKQSSSASSTGFGNAPPCSQYSNLVVWAVLEAGINDFRDCSSMEDITSKKKSLASQHAPITDLLQSAAAVLGDIGKVKKARETSKSKAASSSTPAAKAAAKAAAKGAAAPPSGPKPVLGSGEFLIFSELIEHCQQMKTARLEDIKVDGALDLAQPVVISVAEQTFKAFMDEKSVAASMNDFKVTFGTTAYNRAQGPVSEECAAALSG